MTKTKPQMQILPLLLLLDPIKDMVKADSVDYSAYLKNGYSQTDNFQKFYKMGKMSYDMLKYIPGLSQIGYQGQIHSTKMKKAMLTAHTKIKRL